MGEQHERIYAWVGEDRTGDLGLVSIHTSLGISAAAFHKRSSADLPIVREQVQARADILGVEVRLIAFDQAEVVETIRPKTN